MISFLTALFFFLLLFGGWYVIYSLLCNTRFDPRPDLIRLKQAKGELLEAICKSLGIDKLVNWLSKKL